MAVTVGNIKDYTYNQHLAAMVTSMARQGKTVSALTLLKGACGRVASKIIAVGFDEASLIGLQTQAAKRGLSDDVMTVNLEGAAQGAVSVQGKLVFCDSLWSTFKELNDRAKAGEWGPAPALWIASVTTMSEAIEREVRTCVKSDGGYNLYHMNPDKWNVVNATHANIRLILSQWPGHRVLEAHLDPGGGGLDDRGPQISLSGKQKSGYPKNYAQLLELVCVPSIGKGEARRYFETRANGTWARGVRDGDERLEDKEPADWSVIAYKLGLKMLERKEPSSG